MIFFNWCVFNTKNQLILSWGKIDLQQIINLVSCQLYFFIVHLSIVNIINVYFYKIFNKIIPELKIYIYYILKIK
jgi:hypothetical protein